MRVGRGRGATWLLAMLLAACGGGGGGGSGDPPGNDDTTPPSAPQGLNASAQSGSEVRLQWQASTDAGTGVSGYRVYRDGGTDPVATVGAVTTYTDTGLAPGTRYSYAVRAFDGATPANVSAASANVSVTTPVATVVLTTVAAFPDLPAFTAPVLALQAPDAGSTWYVVEQAGRVLAFEDAAGASTTRSFIDLRTRVTSGGERGLLGMAFHPGWPTDPRAYLSYTTTVGGGLVSRLSEFRTTDAGATLDPASEVVLIEVPQPADNHNGGNVAFGPDDGLLYVGFGDGGSAGDPWGPIGNAQSLTTLLGKMLRIDVDGSTGAVRYAIPAGNPHAANATCEDGAGAQPCPEIFAFGFRNPWRWSFDRATGDLWVGDVGQDEREEVDRVVAGGNYGWRCFEGTATYDADCGPNAGTSLAPLVQYDHDAGHSITGGFIYRGTSIAGLEGRYVFGDFVSGWLWHVPGTTQPTLTVTQADGIGSGLGIASFAEDAQGELFVVDYAGELRRVVEAHP